MEKNSGYYFKTATALKIWRDNDADEEKKLLECMLAEKEAYFRRVIVKYLHIPEYKLTEIAETAFVAVWTDLRAKGMAGVLNIEGDEYGGFFYKAFKNNYLKLLDKEERQKRAERDFSKSQPESHTPDEQKDRDSFSNKTQAVLNKMDERCREWLVQHYREAMDYDAMLARYNAENPEHTITRHSLIKMISRCRGRFVEIWSNIK